MPIEPTPINLIDLGDEQEVELVFVPEEPKWSLEEIILSEDVKGKINKVIHFVKNSKKIYEEWGFKRTHKKSLNLGINFYGLPGTGKTMAAHALCKSLGRKILVVNYSDIESKYVGETPKNIRRAFEAAKASNSILFFDEADAILSKRVTDMTQAVDVSVNQTRSVMLMLMNEYKDFIIFATNFISNLDVAFMRRISMHVEIPLPDEECRRKLWHMYTPPECPNNLDYDALAKKFDGLSGSDIANATFNAAQTATERQVEEIDEKIISEEVENILASKRANAANSKGTLNLRELVYEAVENILSKRDKLGSGKQ